MENRNRGVVIGVCVHRVQNIIGIVNLVKEPKQGTAITRDRGRPGDITLFIRRRLSWLDQEMFL